MVRLETVDKIFWIISIRPIPSRFMVFSAKDQSRIVIKLGRHAMEKAMQQPLDPVTCRMVRTACLIPVVNELAFSIVPVCLIDKDLPLQHGKLYLDGDVRSLHGSSAKRRISTSTSSSRQSFILSSPG